MAIRPLLGHVKQLFWANSATVTAGQVESGSQGTQAFTLARSARSAGGMAAGPV